MFQLLVQICKGLIRNQSARRLIMFYDVIVALVMVFGGACIHKQWVAEHLLFSVVYWAACMLLTFLAILLALFDMLLVRSAARRERRRLEAQYLHKSSETEGHGENPRGTGAN
ncbi:MAG TPA: hypothetical protein VGH90_04460 [Chthoniobacteraceae bacterium]